MITTTRFSTTLILRILISETCALSCTCRASPTHPTLVERSSSALRSNACRRRFRLVTLPKTCEAKGASSNAYGGAVNLAWLTMGLHRTFLAGRSRPPPTIKGTRVALKKRTRKEPKSMKRPTKPPTVSTYGRADDEPEVVQSLFSGRISGTQVVGPTVTGETTLLPPMVLAATCRKGG